MLQINDHVAISRAITSKSVSATIGSLGIGETGIIMDVDPETGDVLIRLDRIFPALRHWRNMVPIASADAATLKLLGRLFLIDRIEATEASE